VPGDGWRDIDRQIGVVAGGGTVGVRRDAVVVAGGIAGARRIDRARNADELPSGRRPSPPPDLLSCRARAREGGERAEPQTPMPDPWTTPASPSPPIDAEAARLAEDAARTKNWKRWGPYLSERQWATVREDYAESLFYLDGRLADATIQANRKNKTIEMFLTGDGDEIDIAIKNVSIEDLRTSPYKATVDFEKIYFTRSDHLEIKRERYLANFVFVIKEHVPNSIVPVNPLGLTITYFREDQAFR
jgi:hypothetical protein